MEEQQTWRTLLRSILADPQERQRLARELKINPITFMRWINNESKPRYQNLAQLLNALPKYRKQLRELLAEEFAEFTVENTAPVEEISLTIPSAFYAEVLRAYITTGRLGRFWLLGDLILRQMLAHFDKARSGMSITLAQCMPPDGTGRVRSLRERIGRGTLPWEPILDDESMFLGLESLAGYAVTTSRLIALQSQAERQIHFPVQWVKWEESALACPVTREGALAGCLIVSSAQPYYFTPERQELLQDYANLLVLVFEPEEFYSAETIALSIMPSYEIQQKQLTGLRTRLSNLMSTVNRHSQTMNVLQAELEIWKQVEKELLEISVLEGN